MSESIRSDVFLFDKCVHSYRVLKHRVIVIEKNIDGGRICSRDTSMYLLEFFVRVIMGVPCGPPVDPLVDNVMTHKGLGEVWCIDADQENTLFFPPPHHLLGEKSVMTEFNSDFSGPGCVDEVFKGVEIGKGWWELQKIVMD